MAHILLEHGNALKRPHWLADDAVLCEPVSAPNSLLTGKNTGKFANPRPSRRPHRFRYLGTPVSFAVFPYGIEQGILGSKQGSCCPEQGSPFDSQVAPSSARRASVNVRFTPESDQLLRRREMTLWANSDIWHRSNP